MAGWRWAAVLLFACTADDPDPSPSTPSETGKTSPTADTASTRPTADTGTPTSLGALRFAGARPRNLLMISTDTLRRDHVTPYGEALTPFLAERFAEGFALDDFAQCSNWTTASVSCTMTGHSPTEGFAAHGGLPQLQGAELLGAPPEGTPTLATLLGEAGTTSLHYTTNRYFSAEAGVVQGFDEAWVAMDEGAGENALDAWADAATKWDALAPVSPWYLHLHLMEPHRAYDPPEAYLEAVAELDPFPTDLSDGSAHFQAVAAYEQMPPETQALLEEHLRLRYQAEVRYLDDMLAQIWADLDGRGMLDDTLVVFWTDHGEQFWEHGEQLHAHGLYGEESDAIALFWAKNLTPGRWTEPTQAIDMVPTVLEALDVSTPHPLEGSVVGTADVDRPRFFAAIARHGPIQAVEQDGQKLVFSWADGVEVFDRRSNPGETSDLFDPDADQTQALWSLLQPRVQAMGDALGEPPPWPDSLPSPKAP